ncbi:DUF2237 domain-containing protein [Puniceicoccaceae bacterium K14]|nr:DUF2237 domain-containing protein [Puniceicoccaceae bacterium K14]
MAYNVFGDELIPCSLDPITGFYRNGKCDTCADDRGMHTVCVLMTNEFLKFSKNAGNDLSTPAPQYAFPGLVAGDRWCLCLSRWIEAYEEKVAPYVYLKATHISVLEFVDLDILKQFAAD